MRIKFVLLHAVEKSAMTNLRLHKWNPGKMRSTGGSLMRGLLCLGRAMDPSTDWRRDVENVPETYWMITKRTSELVEKVAQTKRQQAKI